MKALAVTLLLVATPWSAFAGDCGGMSDAAATVQELVTSADLDDSGTLTRAEYEGARLQDYGVGFAQSDLDGNGVTSLGEYLELFRKHHPGASDTGI